MPGDLTLPTNPFLPPSDPMAQAVASMVPPAPAQPTIGPSWMTNPAPEPVPAASLPPVAAQPAPLPVAAPPVAAPVAAPVKGGGGGHAGPGPADLEKEIVATGKAEEAGIDKSQAAKGDAADALAQATRDLSTEQRADAVELRDRQEQNRLRNEELDRQDADNLKKAKDYTIPDFWAGAPGAKVASIISMAMGGIAQGILGGANGAKDIIDRNVSTYFDQQKAKVDNLYKYAEQQGKLDDRTRLRYAQELVDLKDQHAAVQQSILTHINEVERQNAGNVARADTDALKAKLAEDIAKSRGESRVQRQHIAEMASQVSKNYAEANKANAEAAVAGTLKITQKLEETAVRDPDTGKVLGHAPSKQGVLKLDAQLNGAKSYVEALEALKQDIRAGYHANPYSDDAKRRMTLFNDAIAKGRAARQLGVSNKSIELEEGAFSGPGVFTHTKLITPQQIDLMIQDAKSRRDGLVRQLTPPAAQERSGPEPNPEPAGSGALPPGLPAGSSATGRKTKDGRAVYKLPNGQLVAG